MSDESRDGLGTITLTQIERALSYWRLEAIRPNDRDPLAAPDMLLALEHLYRRLVAARLGAVLVAQLLPKERIALHEWGRTLPADPD